MSDNIRRRAGSLSAPKIWAMSLASTSDISAPTSGLQQLTTFSSTAMDLGCDIYFIILLTNINVTDIVLIDKRQCKRDANVPTATRPQCVKPRGKIGRAHV